MRRWWSGRGRLAGVVAPTPAGAQHRLSGRAAPRCWLKREDLQVVRSYKVRGAYNLIAQLDAARARRASSRERRQPRPGRGVRVRGLGVHGRVYLPRTTPRQKRERIAALGGDLVEIVVAGDTYDEAAAAARDAAAPGRPWSPPSTTRARSPGRARSPARSSSSSAARRTCSSSRSAAAACWPARSPGSGERHPRCAVVGVEPRAPRAWPRPWPPGAR